MNVKRAYVPLQRHADLGIHAKYPIDRAAWIWHPELVELQTPALLRFRRKFISDGKPLTIHVSADQHYELMVDGVRIAKGPDKSEVFHWHFASYRISLPKGAHVLEAVAWWWGDLAPQNLLTWRGGFVLAADGVYDEQLTTGKAAWDVARSEGLSFVKNPHWHFLGMLPVVDMRLHTPSFERFTKAATVRNPLWDNDYGCTVQGWRLIPSPLPDMVDRDITGIGTVRSVAPREVVEAKTVFRENGESAAAKPWQGLVTAGKSLTVPANSTVTVLWDLESYQCAYSEIGVRGGRDASVSWRWAETLVEKADLSDRGDRNQVSGKVIKSIGDTYTCDGKAHTLRSLWWRSGRYCLISVKTGTAPLTVTKLSLSENRYPFENESSFKSSDAQLAEVARISERAVQMCMQDTFVDCPHYEQLLYTGDGRIQMLLNYVMAGDTRLSRHCIDLFDYSRGDRGFVAERFPCREAQMSMTFSMVWPMMVHDYLYWRGDVAWVRSKMAGVRALSACYEDYVNKDGLLENLPGWSFMDWTPEWPIGYAPDAKFGVSGVINCQYALMLLKIAGLEEQAGDPARAALVRSQLERLGGSIVKRFWSSGRGMLSDDLKHAHYSEHTQALAILAGILPSSKVAQAVKGLASASDLARVTIYYSHYLFEAFYAVNQPDMLHDRFSLWKDLLPRGLKTLVEGFGQAGRSECHAFGAHPIYHSLASFAGIRPSTPGFARVRIEPRPPKALPHIEARVPHPSGTISLVLDVTGSRCTAKVELPPGVTGEFVWRGKSHVLAAGAGTIEA